MNTDSLIYYHAIKNGMTPKSALNLVAQARHESGDYKSSLFKKSNNLFGYGYNKSKWQSGKTEPVKKAGEPANFAKYATLYDSVSELIDYWKRRIKEGKISGFKQIEDIDMYNEILVQKKYYTAPANQYLNALKNGLKKIKIEKESVQDKLKINPTAIIIAIVAIIAIKLLK